MSKFNCKEFFETCSQMCSWDGFANKTVMDISKGTKGICIRGLVKLYPNIKRLISINRDADFINSTQKENIHPRLEFHEADIGKWETVSQWEGQIQVIISIYGFDYLNDKSEALRNVYKLLVPGGTAAAVFLLQADYYDCHKEVLEMYNEYILYPILEEPPESHANKLLASDCEKCIADIGFDILQCTDEILRKEFPSDEEFKDFLTQTFFPVTPCIPDERVSTFSEDLLKVYLKYHPRNENGLACFSWQLAKILIGKPM